MKDQIIKIIETEGLTPAKFADEIGVQRSSISHILSDRNKPSFDFIIKILERFQGINADWLLTGKGPMIKASGSSLGAKQQQTTLFDQPVSVREKDEIIPAENTPLQKKSDNELKTNKEIAGQKNKISSQSTRDADIIEQFTNVNDVSNIVFFYNDGTFKKFIPRL